MTAERFPMGVAVLGRGRAGPQAAAASRSGPSTRAKAAQRPNLDRAIGHELLDDPVRDLVLQQPLDALEQLDLIHAHQRNRDSGRAGPARPADPVDVVLW